MAAKGQFCLMVGSSHPSYEDGDILVAPNNRRIRCCHAEDICWPRVDGHKVAGLLRETQPLLEGMLQHIQQYRWDRVNAEEVRRTNLWTGSEVVYGAKPVDDPDEPGRMIHCDVEQFVSRRLAGGKYPFFGDRGSERFYLGGGRTDLSHSRLDGVWQMIEAQTPHRETSFADWPFTDAEMRRFLVIDTDDFDDQQSADYVAPLVDDRNPANPTIEKKRRNSVNWRSLPGISVADVLDQSNRVDARGQQRDRVGLVQAKQRGGGRN